MARSITLISSGQNPVLEIKTIFELRNTLLMLLRKTLNDQRLTAQVFKPLVMAKKEKQSRFFFSLSGDKVCLSL